MIICASGFFNPIHRGHIQYLEKAKELGGRLWVIVNNDEQVKLKGSIPFMDLSERLDIIRALRCVDIAVPSIDEDLSVCKTLEIIKPDVFVNGGDITPDNFREKEVCERLGIKAIFGVGGEKIQNSSTLIKNMLTLIQKCAIA